VTGYTDKKEIEGGRKDADWKVDSTSGEEDKEHLNHRHVGMYKLVRRSSRVGYSAKTSRFKVNTKETLACNRYIKDRENL